MDIHLASSTGVAIALKFFGVHQPRINDLMNNRIEKFSIDVLLNMLQVAGKRVRIQVESAELI